MKIQFSIGACLLILLIAPAAMAEIKVIKSGMHRDGGTICVKYEKKTQVIECCIDHREKVGTGKVFVGGHPAKKDARIASKKEIEAIYQDLTSLSKTERKKLVVEQAIRELHEILQTKGCRRIVVKES